MVFHTQGPSLCKALEDSSEPIASGYPSVMLKRPVGNDNARARLPATLENSAASTSLSAIYKSTAGIVYT